MIYAHAGGYKKDYKQLISESVISPSWLNVISVGIYCNYIE